MRQHKKYIVGSFVFAAVLLLFYGGLVYALLEKPTHEIQWINDCLLKKETIASGINGRKIVVTGGSATLFGISAKAIQQDAGIPAINLGVHAGLSVDYIIQRTKKELMKGDIIILPLEYEHYLYNGEFKEIGYHYVSTFDRAYYERLPFKERYLGLYTLSFRKVLQLLKRHLLFEYEKGAGYDPETLNENGDETNNLGSGKFEQELKPFSIPEGAFTETSGLKLIKDFSDWCRQNDIKFYIAYPPNIYFEVYDSDEYKNYLDNLQRYFRENGIPAIGAPYDSFYSVELFYDTTYHLNRDGARLRTMQLIHALQNEGAL